MSERIKYITDDKGKKTSVIVPLNEWEEILKKNRSLSSKLKIFKGISDGIKEVNQSKKDGIELQSLSDFLNECKDKGHKKF